MKRALCLSLLTALFFLGSSFRTRAQLVALLSPPPLSQVNLLQNGSFERLAVAGIPAAWTNYTAYGTRTVVNASTRCGDNVLSIVDGSDAKGTGLISDAIAITSGASYTAEGYIKRTDF